MPILGQKTPGPTAPAHFDLESIIRPNILALKPYRCARDDYSTGVLLDANENSYGPALGSEGASALKALGAAASELNRYPSPRHDDIKARLAASRGVPSPDWVFLGVGSDEVIDMLYRVLCVPGKDAALVTPPTYGMYSVCAQTNDVAVVATPLVLEGGAFQLDEEAMNAAFLAHPELKLLFICSPGNPTGTLIPLDAIKRIASNPNFKGVVMVDEAYIDFAPNPATDSAASLVKEYANVCVSQTLSKSFGLAGIRLGYLLANPGLVQIMNNAKAPYNISLPTATLALAAVGDEGLLQMRETAQKLNANRTKLIADLGTVPALGRVLGGNAANFVVVEVLDGPRTAGGKPSNDRAKYVYTEMAEHRGVVVRFRGTEPGCFGCVRITVGTEEECEYVVGRLRELLA